MDTLNSHEVLTLFLALGALLGLARLLGEFAQALRMPAVLGELLAGVLLGPTILGNLAPGLFEALFPAQGANAIALDAIATLAIVLFLLVAGMEVDLSTIWRQGKTGLKVGAAGMALPFAAGFGFAWFAPLAFGFEPGSDPLVFALFFATALSITALPVIAKTLMDMGLYRSDIGMIVIGAAIFNDIIGWNIFAIVLGMMDTSGGGGGSEVAVTIGLTLLFAVLMLTVVRWLVHAALPFVQAYTRWPSGVLGFALTLALLGAALTEWIGLHAIFGSFMVGVAIGDSSHLREHTRVTIDHFVSFIFAPVFFASIGLKVNFVSHFDPALVALVLVIACASKLAGGALGARWGGLSNRDSLAIGFAMNSRGAMEIILALLALEAGVIGQQLFVALVVMAIVTSMLSGPAMRLILRSANPWRLHALLSSKLFLRRLEASHRRAAIRELTRAACDSAGLDAETVEALVWAREDAMSTGIGHGVAIPHARIAGLKQPLVAVGLSDSGIDFDAPDGQPAHVLFLLLTPEGEPRAQLELASEVARTFREPHMLEQALRTRGLTDFLALLKSGAAA